MEALTYRTIPFMRAADALKILHELGLPISNELLIRGIQQGQYPFGVVVVGSSDNRECLIFKRQFARKLEKVD